MSHAEDVTGLAKGIGFRLKENFGVLCRETAGEEIKALDQPARAQLRKYGVRFGAFNVYLPLLLKPAAAELALTLWALKHAGEHNLDCRALPPPPRAGLTSVSVDKDLPEVFYRVAGYHVCGPRAVRIDMLERLADQIRSLLSWRAKEGVSEEPPKGSTGDGAFLATPEMMSILGCSCEELGDVLTTLGFRKERRPIKTPPAGSEAGIETSSTRNDEVRSVAQHQADETTVGSASQAGDDESKPCLSADKTDDPGSAAPTELTEDGVTPVEVTDEVAAKHESADTITAETPAQASTSEPEFEEIWRPAKRHKPGGGRRRTRAHDHRSGSHAQRGDKADPGDRAKSGDRRELGSTAPQSTNVPDQHGTDRGREPGQNGAAQKPKTRGKPPFRDKKSKRRRDGANAGVFKSAPQSKKGLDPNSPFAALSALKDELEKKSQQ